LVKLPLGEFAFADITEDNGGGLRDFHLFIASSVGFYVNGSTYGSSGMDEVYSLDHCFDKGFIMCGYSNGFDNDGTKVYLVKTDSTGITSAWVPYVNEIPANENNIVIHPNPIGESVSILLPGVVDGLEIVLADMSGRIIQITDVAAPTKNFVLPTPNLAAGTYMIILQNKMGIIGRAKLSCIR